MEFVIFDDPIIKKNLLPLTFYRPVSEIRIGILTISEKWKSYLQSDIFFLTDPYLSFRYKNSPFNASQVFINGAICPDQNVVNEILRLPQNTSLVQGDLLIAYKGSITQQQHEFEGVLRVVKNLWDIFSLNTFEIIADYKIITKGRISENISDVHSIVYSPENIFLEEGVVIKAAILNAENGPIYIGKNAQVHEGAIIKGPFALCEGAHVNMGAKIRGDSTVGPFSKVGGEISNSVIFGYSNKGHDGFLGNSVIGEWCNLGADTNTSNLKNNYKEVEIFNYTQKKLAKTGLQFCGLIMGDHSKTGINTMFNTGTVTGFCANIFGGGFPPKFIPSFSWGGAGEMSLFDLDKSFETAERVMARRNIPFDETEKAIFLDIYKQKELFEPIIF